MELKNTIIKSITAILCVIAICVTAVANTTKICDARKAGATQTADNGEVVADDTYADPTADDTAAPADDTAAPADDTAAPADDTAAPADDTTAPADGTATTAKATDNGTKAPTTVADIVAKYNAATAAAFNKKAPFTKSRTTTEKAYSAGVALNASKSIVYKFMGIGDANKFTKTVTAEDKDSYHKYLQASKLTANDVTKATCTQNGANYTLTIYVKSGASTVKDGSVVSSNNSALDRSGLACGDNDKDYWDHKTAENVMSAISEVPGCSKANINESYSNAVITAVVNASTGNLVSLKASFTFKFDLSSVMGSKGNAEAQTVVNMTGFKF